MGTRADFYVAHSETDLEWLGSIGWDGYDVDDIGTSEDKQDFRQRVSRFLDSRKDATMPANGWPWPWRDSRLTDYAYVWVDGKGVIYRYGDDYPMSNTDRTSYIPDDGKCDAYVAMKRENELHAEAALLEDDEAHPEWSDEDGFHKASGVEANYIYPDMADRANVRRDEGSGVIFLR
jgi:hypothetical protein